MTRGHRRKVSCPRRRRRRVFLFGFGFSFPPHPQKRKPRSEASSSSLTPLAPRHEYNRGVCVLLSRSETMSRLPLGGCSFSFAIFPQNQENQKENYHNKKNSTTCHRTTSLPRATPSPRSHRPTTTAATAPPSLHPRARRRQDVLREVVEKGGCCLDGFFCFLAKTKHQQQPRRRASQHTRRRPAAAALSLPKAVPRRAPIKRDAEGKSWMHRLLRRAVLPSRSIASRYGLWRGRR
jgi:hypothetical protein